MKRRKFFGSLLSGPAAVLVPGPLKEKKRWLVIVSRRKYDPSDMSLGCSNGITYTRFTLPLAAAERETLNYLRQTHDIFSEREIEEE